MTLGRFQAGLKAGQYCYPFEFLLPNELTGSFESKGSFIRYKLRASLSQGYNDHNTQFYEIFLNIVEPSRFTIPPASDKTS